MSRLASRRDRWGVRARPVVACQVRATTNDPTSRVVSSPSEPLGMRTRQIPPSRMLAMSTVERPSVTSARAAISATVVAAKPLSLQGSIAAFSRRPRASGFHRLMLRP
ncbi:hypothetical protein LX83_006974 [Goodfellowiella coeruleoviolacea]|uniref:Uncharacterized protein n=1 Tax=Goodfellowiella coeruleoviolacea TaxID=334858 RepID=A0AAE3GKV9_9PSEU|nr:hypothetical protein [Goodfellowiella coeruleoviolacea]